MNRSGQLSNKAECLVRLLSRRGTLAVPAELRDGGRRYQHLDDVSTASLGLSLAAFTILIQIQAAPGTRACDLAALSGLDKSTVSHQISELQTAGLISRDGERPGRRGYLLVYGRPSIHMNPLVTTLGGAVLPAEPSGNARQPTRSPRSGRAGSAPEAGHAGCSTTCASWVGICGVRRDGSDWIRGQACPA